MQAESRQTAGPQLIGESIKAISLSAPKSLAATKTTRERRLDDAFDAFIHRLRVKRGGWSPIWTTSLRAEMWAQFADECRSLLRASGVPGPERAWDLEGIRPEMPEGYRQLAARLMRMIDDPAVILAIGGERGTGKSTLAWGLVIKFCELGRPAVYQTVAEMFDQLSNAPWEAKQIVRSRYTSPDLLVLDEVQVRSDRGWQDSELTTLVDSRYREDKATILLSNLIPEKLRENLGDSIWRRMIETGGQPITTNWKRIEEHLSEVVKARREAR